MDQKNFGKCFGAFWTEPIPRQTANIAEAKATSIKGISKFGPHVWPNLLQIGQGAVGTKSGGKLLDAHHVFAVVGELIRGQVDALQRAVDADQ